MLSAVFSFSTNAGEIFLFAYNTLLFWGGEVQVHLSYMISQLFQKDFVFTDGVQIQQTDNRPS